MPFGVYIHIPFCASRCDYCAFATWTDRHHLHDDYLDALRVELAGAEVPAASSVFIGGGTPTAVDPTALMAVLAAVRRDKDAEVTVECNPDDVDARLADAYAQGGVTRVSLGVQSMVDSVLTALGRRHTPSNVVRAIGHFRSAGLTQINVDLIYGAVGETVADWRRTVDSAIELGVGHVSAYALTVEAGTPLAAEPARHPDDDDLAEKYELADEQLVAAGLENYEVSNWARPGEESRHNRLYWAQGDYLGVGCAAHSHRDGHRWWNIRTPERYIEAVRAGRPTRAAGEYLDPLTRRLEGLQLALRTREGVPVGALSFEDQEEMAHLTATDGDRLVLTRLGRLLANEVAIRLRDPEA